MNLDNHALNQARLRAVERVPFHVGLRRAGSVARAHLPLLYAWPGDLVMAHEEHGGVRLLTPPPRCDALLAAVNAELRRQGVVPGWRDETFAVVDLDDGTPLCGIERAAARFWGTLTQGAHANGYLAGPDARPTHLWIAQRSLHKATDPGLFDNLVGGGVPQGQSPGEALVREGFEEAGLTTTLMAAARAAGVLRLHRDIPEGLQLEDLHTFDLPLPAGWVPANQDGEVAAFTCMPVDEALALAATPAMTVDAALVTLDFGLRHGLLAPRQRAAVEAGLALLRRL